MSHFWNKSKDSFLDALSAVKTLRLFSKKKQEVDYDPGKDTKKLSKRSESRFFRLPKSRKRGKVQFEDNEEEALTESPEIATTLRRKSKELHQKLEATGYSTLERIKNTRKRSRSVDSIVSKESNEATTLGRSRPSTGMFKFARTLGDIPAAISSSVDGKSPARNLVTRTSTTRLKILRKNELSLAISKFAKKRRSITRLDEDEELFNPCPLKKMSNTSLSCQNLNCSYASTDGGVSSGGATIGDSGGGDSPTLLRAFSLLSIDDGIHMSVYREETTAEPSTETII